MDDNDIFLIEVARRGRDGDYTGASEVALLKNRADALEARPNIIRLTDVQDVTPGQTEGEVLQWDSTAEVWEPGPVAGKLTRVQNQSNSVGANDVGVLILQPGLTLTPDTGFVYIAPSFAGSGAQNQVARSDHNHTTPTPVRAAIVPQGYQSTGTRALATTSVVLPAGVSCVVRARLSGFQIRGADPGQCYYQLRITIDGNSRTSPGGASGKWVVQGVPNDPGWEHHQLIVGTGAAITVSADIIYHSGGGFNTDSGELVVDVSTAR